MTLAERIRHFVYQEYIKPARARGQKTVTIRAGDVHADMNLSHRHPAVCGALDSEIFQRKYGVRLVERRGPIQGSNVYFTFALQRDASPVSVPTASTHREADPRPGDSSEQQQAEKWLLDELSARLGVKLTKKRFTLPRGSWLELDGFSQSPPILVEVWAHLGSPKSAQKHKVMTDALKLFFIRSRFVPQARCILIFADEEAAAHFQGTSWMAECLAALDVEVEVVPLPDELRDQVQAAQKRQYR